MNDRLLVGVLWTSAAIAGAIITLIVGFVFYESIPAIKDIGLVRSLTDASWHPMEDRYNLAPMLLNTMLVALGAVAIGAPLGIASALFGRYYAPKPLAWVHRRIIELLAGIPSVVFGLWGLVTLVPIVARIEPPGASLLTAIVVLALMILPTVAVTSDAALGGVPDEYRRGAVALGLGRVAVIWRVMIPAARRGIGVGIVLALGRAIGETMAVLMVAGNVVQIPGSLFDPVRTVTANIALEMGYATDDHRSVLFATGLALMGMIAALIALAELKGWRRRHA